LEAAGNPGGDPVRAGPSGRIARAEVTLTPSGGDRRVSAKALRPSPLARG